MSDQEPLNDQLNDTIETKKQDKMKENEKETGEMQRRHDGSVGRGRGHEFARRGRGYECVGRGRRQEDRRPGCTVGGRGRGKNHKENRRVNVQHMADSTHNYNLRLPQANTNKISRATQTVNPVAQPVAMPRQTNRPVRMPSWDIILLIFIAVAVIPIAAIIGTVFGSDWTSTVCDQEKGKIASEKDDYRRKYHEEAKEHEKDSDYFNHTIRLLEQEKDSSQVEIEQKQRHLKECREEYDRCSQRKMKLDDDLLQCQKVGKQNMDQCTAEQHKQEKKCNSAIRRCEDHITEINKELEKCQYKLKGIKGGSGHFSSSSIGFTSLICIATTILFLSH